MPEGASRGHRQRFWQAERLPYNYSSSSRKMARGGAPQSHVVRSTL
jgi:hypothetical protein